MSATIVVQFGDGADSSALVKVELDGLTNVDADGKEKTQFYPGDHPVFLVHHDATLRLDHIEVSSGMVQDLGSVTRERTQQLSFAAIEGQELEYLPTGSVAVAWYGNDGTLQVTGRSVLPAGVVPAICTVTLQAAFRQFRLIPPALTLAEGQEWPVLVVVHMEAA